MDETVDQSSRIGDTDQFTDLRRALKMMNQLPKETIQTKPNLPGRNTDTKARQAVQNTESGKTISLTDCFPSAFLITSAGTPLN